MTDKEEAIKEIKEIGDRIGKHSLGLMLSRHATAAILEPMSYLVMELAFTEILENFWLMLLASARQDEISKKRFKQTYLEVAAKFEKLMAMLKELNDIEVDE